MLRELLTDHPESVRWPERCRRAVGTRGFAREVHAVLARAREKGLDGEALRRLGRERGRAGVRGRRRSSSSSTSTILDDRSAVDYADLIRAGHDRGRPRTATSCAPSCATSSSTSTRTPTPARSRCCGRWPVTVATWSSSATRTSRSTASAAPRCAASSTSPRSSRRPTAPRPTCVALGTTRRFGPRLLAAAQRVAGRLGAARHHPAEVARAAFLAPRAQAARATAGSVVRTFDTERAEAEHLADLLRRAHLEDGVAWADMAVLVRSGRHIDPAAAPRARGRRGAGRGGQRRAAAGARPGGAAAASTRCEWCSTSTTTTRTTSTTSTPARAEALLTGPLGGLDAGDVRRLARQLRHREKEAAADEGRTPERSRELVRQVVLDPTAPRRARPGPRSQRARAVAELVARTRAQARHGATAEELLWTLWSGTPGRPGCVERSSSGAAPRAGRTATSTRSARCSTPPRGPRRPARPRRRPASSWRRWWPSRSPPTPWPSAAPAASAVRLLTAHRAKGLEWRLVVVAHVQQDGWPDLRRRATLLGADRIGARRAGAARRPRGSCWWRSGGCSTSPAPAPASAWSSRRSPPPRTTASSPRGSSTSWASPSSTSGGRPPRPLSLAGLVASCAGRSPTRPPSRRCAGPPPAGWPGSRASTWASGRSPRWPTRPPGGAPARPPAPTEPVRDPDAAGPGLGEHARRRSRPVRPSGSSTREAGGVTRAHQSANLGEIVHALAQRVATGELQVTADEAGVEALMEHVDAVWDRLEFRTPWARAREHERVAGRPRPVPGLARRRPPPGGRRRSRSSAPCVDLPDGEQVRLAGYADRLELDADGRVVVVDLKTGRTKPTDKSLATNLQLGLYQLRRRPRCRRRGLAGPRAGPRRRRRAGAARAHRRRPAATVQAQAAQADDGPERADLRRRLARAASLLRAEALPGGRRPALPRLPVRAALPGQERRAR